MVPNAVYSGEYSLCPREESVFCCCWIKYPANASYMQLTVLLSSNYVLIDFWQQAPSTKSVHYWEKSFEVTSYCNGSIYFFLRIGHFFCLVYFSVLLLVLNFKRHLWGLILVSLYNVLLCPNNSSWSPLSKFNTDFPSFHLISVGVAHLLPLISLCVSL